MNDTIYILKDGDEILTEAGGRMLAYLSAESAIEGAGNIRHGSKSGIIDVYSARKVVNKLVGVTFVRAVFA